MRLRTQLVLAFLVMAVLPLSGLTLYSYVSSQHAFRKAVQEESAETAQRMSQTMQAVSKDLDERIDRLGDLPLGQLLAKGDKSGDADSNRIYAGVLAALGDSADFVDALEFQPGWTAAPPPPDAPPPPPPSSQADANAPPPPAVVFVLPETPKTAARAAPGKSAAAPVPEGPAGSHPNVLHLDGRTIVLPPSFDTGHWKLDVENSLRNFKFHMSEAELKEIEKQAAEAERQAKEAMSQAGSSDELEKRRDAVNDQLFQIVVGKKLQAAMAEDGHRARTIRAELNAQKVLKKVLVSSGKSRIWRSVAQPGEIPFAIDSQGHLYTPDSNDRQRLEHLQLAKLAQGGEPLQQSGDWIVVSQTDPSSGLTLGIARPIAQSLEQIRNAALRNLFLGLGLIGLALVGILPLSGHITRNLSVLTAGAEKLAEGDLRTRVPVRSKDEFGRLAGTFNRMAHELEEHQRQLVEQQRLQKELELCRHIQEEMLPRAPLRLPFAEIKGVSIPALEVGGDFFNYFALTDGRAAILIGDVSGKGVAAALLMANVQATLKARLPMAESLASLASQLDEEIAAQTPPQTYLTLFMGILDAGQRRLVWVNAGHNPQYALRPDGSLSRMESTGRPLGLLPGAGYEERHMSLSEGDSLFLYTDGLTEAANAQGEQFGTDRLEAVLAKESAQNLDAILERVETAAQDHRRGAEPGDDATMVVLKIDPA